MHAGVRPGHGIIRAPGMHRRPDQIKGWRRVVNAVHAAGGRIYCQLWHCGRISHPDIRGGESPVALSPIAATGNFFLPSGRADFPVPRKLATSEIAGIVEDFGRAARLAKEAGFDKAKATAALESGKADLVSFGVLFIANPDLPERFRRNAPLNKSDPSIFYGEGPKGYTDYPALPV